MSVEVCVVLWVEDFFDDVMSEFSNGVVSLWRAGGDSGNVVTHANPSDVVPVLHCLQGEGLSGNAS